jgi:hypothetical protein
MQTERQIPKVQKPDRTGQKQAKTIQTQVAHDCKRTLAKKQMYLATQNLNFARTLSLRYPIQDLTVKACASCSNQPNAPLTWRFWLPRRRERSYAVVCLVRSPKMSGVPRGTAHPRRGAKKKAIRRFQGRLRLLPTPGTRRRQTLAQGRAARGRLRLLPTPGTRRRAFQRIGRSDVG